MSTIAIGRYVDLFWKQPEVHLMDDVIIEGEVIEPGIDPDLEAQVQDFEWRLNGLGRTYQHALWWASEQPFRVGYEDRGSEKRPHVAQRFVRACGDILVTVGEVLVERSGIEQESEEPGPGQDTRFSPIPPIQFDFSKKE